MNSGSDAVTLTLAAIDRGEDGAAQRLLPLVYDDLRQRAHGMMADERAGHTLQPTALVHEAYLKLAGHNQSWKSKTHFFNAAAQAMRRILVDHARTRGRQKRGSGRPCAPIENLEISLNSDGFDWAGLEEAMLKLQEMDGRAHQVVMLRFFGGMEEKEIGQVLCIGERQVRRDWNAARLWLASQMQQA